jgi:hypothetical protein
MKNKVATRPAFLKFLRINPNTNIAAAAKQRKKSNGGHTSEKATFKFFDQR